LGLERWKHLDFGGGTELTQFSQQYLQEDLSLDPEEPARLLSSQIEWLGRMAVHTQLQPGEMDTVEKLKAASTNPKFRVDLLANAVVLEVDDDDDDEDSDEDEFSSSSSSSSSSSVQLFFPLDPPHLL
jgi:hypothetical protein